tara:strand:- start:674 stop:802 length:129 start_codon:yes stop_codon:yes gene_type:complete
MPMSREDREFINEHVANTIVWFVGLPLSVIIVLLGIIAYNTW